MGVTGRDILRIVRKECITPPQEAGLTACNEVQTDMIARGVEVGSRVWILVVVAASVVCGAALAHEVTVANLTVVHPRLIVASSDADTGYLVATLVNRGMVSETLQAVLSNEARSILIEDSIKQTFVSIPGDSTVRIGPGGAGVRFYGLKGPHFEESTIRLLLVFEHVGEVVADAVVQIHAENN